MEFVEYLRKSAEIHGNYVESFQPERSGSRQKHQLQIGVEDRTLVLGACDYLLRKQFGFDRMDDLTAQWRSGWSSRRGQTGHLATNRGRKSRYVFCSMLTEDGLR